MIEEEHVYNTIVTSVSDKEYEHAIVMNSYSSMKEAKANYDKDIDAWKSYNPTERFQYGIREDVKHED